MEEHLKQVLKFKKYSQIVVYFTTTLVIILSVGFTVTRVTAVSLDNDYLFETFIIYEDNPATFFTDMKLIWDDTAYHVINMENPRKGRQIGFAIDEYSTWSIHEVIGYGTNILLAVESEDVWRVMNHDPPLEPLMVYILENATQEDKLLRTLSILLYADGRAVVNESPLSSFMIRDLLYYTVADGEVLIHSEDKSILIRFDIDTDGALVYRSATIPLRAEVGARYVAIND